MDPDAPERGKLRPPGRPATNRSTPLDRDDIVRTAHGIVRDRGLAALSMRALGDALGVTPMAIYHHVGNKPALVQLLVDDVWAQVADALDPAADDLVELVVDICRTTRRVWLANIELANLALAVAPADQNLVDTATLTGAILEAAEFPDAGLAFSAALTFTMGSIATAANRRTSSAYFGRDPDDVLASSLALLDDAGASPTARAIVEARFDAAEDANFEPSLRALLRGLLGDPTG
jgi:AcrR family transcriptional regulator